MLLSNQSHMMMYIMIYGIEFWGNNIFNNQYNQYKKSQKLNNLKYIFNLDIDYKLSSK